MINRIITWDLGATKCNAGLIEYHTDNNQLNCKKTFSIKLKATTSLPELIFRLQEGLDFSFAEADAICIGAAGFYNGSELLHTCAYPYRMNFATIANHQKWPTYAIIHDYASIICATFTSYMNDPKNVKRLNNALVHPHNRRVALGIGTGLGIKDGILFSNGDFWLGQNEIGHIGIIHPPIASTDYLSRHKEILSFLKKKFAHSHNISLTFEKILTGQGTANLYEFFYSSHPILSPEEIGEKMRAGLLPELLHTFAWYLGLFTGTVQLTFMPEGGIWITGGVVMNHLEAFECADFYAGITASPAYIEQREQYPLGVLCNHEHALIGNAYYAIKRLM